MEKTDSVSLLPQGQEVNTPRHRISAPVNLTYTGLSQQDFNDKYGYIPDNELTAKSLVRSIRHKCQCSKSCLAAFVRRHIPVIDLVTTYRFKEYILGDVIAGVSTAALQVPLGMGYALLADLPPIIGLYTSFFPVLVYFIFGRSPHVSMGTMALTSLIIAASISQGLPKFIEELKSQNLWNESGFQNANSSDILAENDFNSPILQEKIRIAMSVSLTAGIALVVMGVFNLGIMASYISEPFISGYLAAANLQVLTHQVKHLLGIQVGSHSGPLSYFYILRDICLNLKHTNIATLVTSIIAIVLLILVKKLINERFAKKLPVPVPIDVIVVIIATVISYFCLFEDHFGVRIVKTIPQGLPEPFVPTVRSEYLVDGTVCGLVNFILIFMMIKMFADKHNYAYDATQELLAAGFCGIFGAFFWSTAASTSPPRCILSEQSGGRTQLAQLISALFILLTLLYLAPLFEPLPVCILSALIVVSSIPLFRYYLGFLEYWHTSKIDMVTWVLTFFVTMFIGVQLGIISGLVVTVVSVVVRTQRPYSTQLKVSTEGQLLLDPDKHAANTTVELEGIVVLRFEAPIYFGTIDIFKQRIFSLASKPVDILLKQTLEKTVEPSGVGTESKLPDSKVEQIDKLDHIVENGMTENQTNGSIQVRSKVSSGDDTLHTIIVDCSVISFVDTAGAKALALLHKEYRRAGVNLWLAGVVSSVRHTLTRVDSCADLVSSAIYPSVYDAVLVAQANRQDSEGVEVSSEL